MPVTIALQTNALTTLAVVLDELDLTSDGDVVDSRLNRYINAASDFVERYCRRSFARSDAVVERVRGFGGPRILLQRRPVLTITSIAVDGTTITASEYIIEDADAGIVYRENGWPWSALSSGGITGALVPGTEEPSIVVTYGGGYVTPAQVAAGTFTPRTLPSDLEDAVVQLVVSRYRRQGADLRVKSESILSASVTYGEAAVAPEILATLERYAGLPHS